MMVRQDLSKLSAGVMALAMAATLGGCSVPNAINPAVWYRDLSGASKNDALDKDQSNQKNLEAGGKEPYPNLGDVPNAPDDALSQANRDALRKSLLADRDNAQYSDEQLRAGVAPPGAIAAPPPVPAPPEPAAGTKPKTAPAAPVAAALPAAAPATPAAAASAPAAPSTAGPAPEPAPAAPAPVAATAAAQKQAAAPPQESALVTPTIAHVPEGDAPAPPPPPPNLTSSAGAANPPPKLAAALGSGERRAPPSSSVAVGSIIFSEGSATLSDKDRNLLSEIAATQHKEGGELRVVGYAESAKGGTVADQELASLKLALNRAKAVAHVLGEEGVASQSIDVEAAPSRADDAAAARAEVYLEH